MPGPPPAPPPPPPLLSSAPFLPSSRRTPTNSDRETRNSIPAPPQSPAPGLDAQTLQYAATGLRKTQYNKSLRSNIEDISDGRLDGENVQLSRRYWKDSKIDEPMERNKTRETLHATSFDPRHTVQISNVHRYSNPLKQNSPEGPAEFSISYNQYSSSSSSPYKQSSSKGINESPLYITDPQSRIHQYATQTPAYSPVYSPGNRYPTADTHQYEYNYKRQEKKLSDSQEPAGTKFAKDLRDQGLTRTQRIANQFQESQIRDIAPPNSIESLYKQKQQLGNDQIDSLIREMQWKMETGIGAAGENNCCKCGEGISNERPGCTALDQMFHIDCFTCKECGKQLAGASFYNVDGKPMCETDYKNTLERCSGCGEIIMDKLLRASGSTFHPQCFACSICKKCLDGVPFTVDSANKIHCVDCFHDKFAPRCAVCAKPIVPEEGEKESVRVVAMDKSFHVNCYRCEDCNMQLSSKLEGQGCYPLDQHLYCKNCNGKRLIALSRAA